MLHLILQGKKSSHVHGGLYLRLVFVSVVSADALTPSWPFLHLCSTGVFGQNQDEVTLQHTAVLGPYTGLICEDLSLVIDCPSGYFTNFLSASYGRYDNQDTCMEDGEIVTLTDGCLDDTSVLEVRGRGLYD